MQINADWALWSKRPGTHDDYSVLASSKGTFSRADFSAILSRFAPGTPSTNTSGAAALPWMTVSWVGVNDHLHLGVAIQKATGQSDAVNRSIVKTSYFCIPYRELIDAPVSYTSLYEKVAALELPLEDGEPIPLTLPPLDQDQLARTIADIGEMAVATTAALLLRGPVSVIRADASTLQDRLSFIEAVVALLPYGYRAKYTAATWSDSGSRHRLRLAFAERPRDGARPVAWREVAAVPADDPVVQGYLRQFRRLRGQIPSFAAAPEFSLAEIVGRLAHDGQPQKFEQPKPAVDSLIDIDLPFAVLDMVINGTADLPAVRRIFSTARVEELPPDGQRTVLAALIGYSDPADWLAIERSFGPIAGDEPRALLPALAESTHRLLWQAAPSPAVNDYFALAVGHGLGDEMLAELVPPPGSAGGWPAALTAAAALAREHVVAQNATGSYPLTLRALGSHPAVACELLAQVAGSDPDANRTMDWLTPVIPQVVVPFNTVLTGRSQPLGRHSIGHLATAGSECVRALVAAAAQVGRLDLVLPGFLLWLATGATRPAEAQRWRDQLLTLRLTDAVTAADADIGLLVVGWSPRSLLSAASQADWPVYADRFISAWAAATGPGGRDADQLGAGLSRYLNERVWASDPVLARAVVDLTRKLTSVRFLQALVGAVASNLSAQPDSVRGKFAQDWLADVERDHPGVVKDGALISLRALRPGVPTDRIAALCVRACRQGAAPAAAASELAKSGAVDTQFAAVALLEDVRSAFTLDGVSWEQTGAWLHELIVSFAFRYFDEAAGAEFRQRMSWVAAGGVLHDLDLLSVAAYSGRDAVDLTDDERRGLEHARNVIDRLLRSARRTPAVRGRSRMGRGGREAPRSEAGG